MTKISGYAAAASFLTTDELPVNESGTTKKVTGTQVRLASYLTSASTVTATGYAADTYLAGSAITIPTAGGWRAGTQYHAIFDMSKTAAGIATIIVTLRMGTLGTTGDAAIMTWTLSAQTAAADIGQITLDAVFRTVGAGTSAVIQGLLSVLHQDPGTGLTTTGGSGDHLVATSAGFNSTTQTIIGLSFNGGASFVGTNTIVAARMDNV